MEQENGPPEQESRRPGLNADSGTLSNHGANGNGSITPLSGAGEYGAKTGRPFFEIFNAFVDGGWIGKISATSLGVYLCYLRHMRPDGLAYPGNDKLAEAVGHKTSAHVRKARAELIAMGLLERVTIGGNHQSLTSHFRVTRLPCSGHLPEIGAPAPNPGTCPNSAHLPEIGAERCPDSARIGAPIPRTEGAYRRGTLKGHKAKPSKAAESPTTGATIPESLRTPAFEAAWAGWEQHRRELRKPNTPTAAKQQLAELAAMGEARAISAINFSIRSGWQGIFEPRANNNGTPKQVRTIPRGGPNVRFFEEV